MTQPLAGLAVLDLSVWRPGPYATSLLCALGADVLKVEPPGGDPMRHYTDLFDAINRGKRSIVLDLKDEHDRARALELASRARVMVEGFRPGVMQRLGLDEPTIRIANPTLVYCSISGYGQTGPRAPLPGHDVNYQAWGGTLSPEGRPATMPPLPMADLASGMAAAFGICAALLGGQGAYLDLSMTDVMSTWTGNVGHTSSPDTTAPATTAPDTTAPDTTTPTPVPGYGLFLTADAGQIALGVVNEDHFWSALCKTIGLGQHADLTFAERSARGAELQDAVTHAIARHHRDPLVKTLIESGVPTAPVLDRAAMVASAPFPNFPIRWNEAEPTGEAPAVDQHRGQGFLRGP